MSFEVGEMVTWSSQGLGVTKSKVGEVVLCVPANLHPMRMIEGSDELSRLRRLFDGMSRSMDSYVVRVRSGNTEASAYVLYWPRTNDLRSVNLTISLSYHRARADKSGRSRSAKGFWGRRPLFELD